MADEPDDQLFGLSDETRERWAASQRRILGFGVVAGISFVLLVVSGVARGGLLIAAVVVVVVYALVAGSYVYRRSSRFLPAGAVWAAASSVHVAAIRSAGLAGNLVVKRERTFRFLTRGVGAVMGRLEVGRRGLRWSSGWSARLLGVRGEFEIPWTSIERIEVGDVPGTVRQLGGGIAVHLKDRHRLDAQFLGSTHDLREALAQSPLENRE
jgi:hypothetical protein